MADTFKLEYSGDEIQNMLNAISELTTKDGKFVLKWIELQEPEEAVEE